MALGQHVTFLSNKVAQEQKMVDEMFWTASTSEELLAAERRETALEYLEELLDDGEEYYIAF